MAIEFDIWTCELDPEINIMVVNPESVEEWKALADEGRFSGTHGFCLFGEDIDPMIVMDSRVLEEEWFTEDHFLVIVAHELGHIRLETTNEEQADLYGIQLLEERGHVDAVALHRSLHEQRKISGWYEG